jgi:hypothetical protein
MRLSRALWRVGWSYWLAPSMASYPPHPYPLLLAALTHIFNPDPLGDVFHARVTT